MQKVMNAATSSLQSYKPVNNICQHVCAFHFYANDMSRQVRSSTLTPSFPQDRALQLSLSVFWHCFHTTCCCASGPSHNPVLCQFAAPWYSRSSVRPSLC